MNSAGYETYKLKLRVLSPLYIGGGEKTRLSRLEYIYSSQNKKIYILDSRKWMGFLSKAGLLDDYMGYIKQAVSRRQGGVDNYNYLLSKRAIPRDHDNVLKGVSLQVLSTASIQDFKCNDLYLFIRDCENNPYIPGSSIKGAIGTAVMSCFYQNPSNQGQGYFNQVQRVLGNMNRSSKRDTKNNLNRIYKNVEKQAFEYSLSIEGKNYTFNGMSGISISDSTPFSNGSLFLARKKDLVLSPTGELKGTKGISLYREYAKPGTEVEFTLTIDKYKIKKEFNIKDIGDILKALENRWHLLFGEKGIFSQWDNIESYIPLDVYNTGCRGLVALGGGAGYHSKSAITSLAPDSKKANEAVRQIMHFNFPKRNHLKDRPISPRALKVAEYSGKNQIIGICRISVV